MVFNKLKQVVDRVGKKETKESSHTAKSDDLGNDTTKLETKSNLADYEKAQTGPQVWKVVRVSPAVTMSSWGGMPSFLKDRVDMVSSNLSVSIIDPATGNLRTFNCVARSLEEVVELHNILNTLQNEPASVAIKMLESLVQDTQTIEDEEQRKEEKEYGIGLSKKEREDNFDNILNNII